MPPKISVVLPCRKGSKRVVGKNTRKFYKYEMGLFELKMEQLLSVEKIDSIFISTDDENIIRFVEDNYNSTTKDIIIEKRPDHLAADDCLDDLIIYLSDVVPTDILIWTHVTSPFFTPYDFANAIDVYLKNMNNGFDSLVSVTSMHTFALQSGKWISHDTTFNKWPRKQDVDPIMLINGAIYIINRNLMRSLKNRIGIKPYYHKLKGLSWFDIDYEEDFSMAEKIAPCIFS